MREENLRSRIHLRQELSQDHSKLAVSDSDGTGAVAKRWKTCSLGIHLRQMLLQGENLHTRIQMRQELSHEVQECLQQHLLQMKSESASFPALCDSSCRIGIRCCNFFMILQQLLSQMNPSMQVFLPHKGAPPL